MPKDLLHPVRDWYIIKRFSKEEVSPGGIVIPGNEKKNMPFGRILARGPGKTCDFAWDRDNKRFAVLPMSAEQGDVVFFEERGARRLELDGIGEVWAVNEADIIGVVEQDAEAKINALREAGLL